MTSGVYPRTDETRLKMSIAKKGKNLSKEHKRKIGEKTRMRKVSKETKLKISKSRIGNQWGKGHVVSEEAKKKIGAAHTGEKNWSWRGGVTNKYKKIRNSVEYKLWRNAVLKKDNYTCVWCGVSKEGLHVDHIKPFILFPELRFAIDNGRTLCLKCHCTTESWGKTLKYYQKINSYS